MLRLLWFLGGGAAMLIAVAMAAVIALPLQRGFSTLDPPSALERWVATTAHEMTIPAAAKGMTNPVAPTPEAIAEGRAHWADHCASCHANDGSGETEMGRHLYPPAPDMRAAGTQRKSDGELFFIIRNGVRMTGMPGWGGIPGHEEDSWKLVCFIRHLTQLTPQEELEMHKLNPKSPDDLREEQEELDFLKGGTTDEPEPHHH